jgi:uncharacterized RDD family membrane protein YckC
MGSPWSTADQSDLNLRARDADVVPVKAISKNLLGASGPSLDNRRVLAGVVDLGVVGAGALVIFLAAGGTMTGLLGVVMVGWALFYYYATESQGGQTVGKRLLGLRVERQGGGTPGEREIVMRTLLRVVDGIGFYLVGLVTMMATGERRQRLGDMAAGTVVVDGSATATPKAASQVSTMAAAPAASAAPAPTSPPANAPTLEAELFAPEPEFHPELQDEAYLDEAALADAGIFGLADPEVISDAEPEPVTEPELDLGADLAEDGSPRIEIISEAEEEEAFTTIEDGEDHGYAPEPFGADWDLGGTEETDEPVAAEEPAEETGDAPSLPRVSSPALAELAEDVAASARDRDPDAERAEEEPVAEAAEPDAPAEEELTVRTVETVSPMDLVMSSSDDEQDEDAEAPHHPAGRTGGAA